MHQLRSLVPGGNRIERLIDEPVREDLDHLVVLNLDHGQGHQQSYKISMAWLRTLFVAFRRGVLDIEELCYTYSAEGEFMHGRHRLTDTEIAEIHRRRPGVRVSLACGGMYLTAEEEALFERMDRERLTA